ncbi:hypothetical protein IC582_019732 [Cucumis melo]
MVVFRKNIYLDFVNSRSNPKVKYKRVLWIDTKIKIFGWKRRKSLWTKWRYKRVLRINSKVNLTLLKAMNVYF